MTCTFLESVDSLYIYSSDALDRATSPSRPTFQILLGCPSEPTEPTRSCKTKESLPQALVVHASKLVIQTSWNPGSPQKRTNGSGGVCGGGKNASIDQGRCAENASRQTFLLGTFWFNSS
jgi:hypothetical protein